MIELVSDSGCETLNDMISRAKSGSLFGALSEERHYMGGLQTGSHRMVIQRFQDSVVLVTVIDWWGKAPRGVVHR